jgi:CubicO group peptidase (beta-lactamase class C family)
MRQVNVASPGRVESISREELMDDGSGLEGVLAQAGLLRPGAGFALAACSPRTGVVSRAGGTLLDGTAVTPETPMYAASITKQVVGALAAQQVLADLLRPDDRVLDLLPALPPWAAAIRVRHLIHHTSGLHPTEQVLAALGLPSEQHLDNDMVMQGLDLLPPPDTAPGTAFGYSNIGYVVLAEVLVAVTGAPVPFLAQQSLFAPLGMAASRLGPAESAALPTDVRPPRTIGDGGLWSSALDLLTWLDALSSDRLGPELTRLVQRPGRLDDGTALDYAWGVTARSGSEGTSYTHGGNWPGWSAKTVRRPATGTAVVLLTTSDDVPAVSRAALELHDLLPP